MVWGPRIFFSGVGVGAWVELGKEGENGDNCNSMDNKNKAKTQKILRFYIFRVLEKQNEQQYFNTCENYTKLKFQCP